MSFGALTLQKTMTQFDSSCNCDVGPATKFHAYALYVKMQVEPILLLCIPSLHAQLHKLEQLGPL